MTSIHPINVNTQGLNPASGFAPRTKAEEKEKKALAKEATAEKTPLSPDKVLDFLAQSAIAPVPKKTIDPSKYVDKASEARIASFMASFEDKVAEGLKAFDKEFPGVAVSESTKLTVTLAGINKEAQGL